jgi:adenylate cyclase
MVPSGDRSVESLQTVQRTILFADVSNSTRIYEALGDTHALSVVSHLLGQLEQCVAKQAGSVVKTMGDAMVCAFEDPDAALHAACDMMALLAPLPARPYGKLSIQIGLTCGPVVLTEGDVFGDTVNVCARLVALANAEQVLTSQQTVDALTPALRARCRTLFPVQIKGREEEVMACEVLWRSDPDVTAGNLARTGFASANELFLKLSSEGNVFTIDNATPSARLGRDKGNDVMVTSHFASRFHARIHKREGGFVISDQSSNGTYLLADDGAAEVLLQREEAVLGERGWIGLGMSASRHGDHVVRYRIEREGG